MIDPLQRLTDRYQILQQVREESLCQVRLRSSGEERLVRVLRPPPDAALHRRIRRTVRAVRRLDHPHIARLYDLLLDDEGDGVLVMELVRGLELRTLIRRDDPPPVALVLEIARQGLDAVALLQARGILSWPVSPDKLKLTRDREGAPSVKLIGPGIASLAAPRRDPNSLSETRVRYASPEELRGEASPQSAIYAFGLVLYELLTGRSPISGRSPSSILAGHLFRPPLAFADSDPRGRVSADLRSVVLRSLAKDPGDRFADAGRLARALAATGRGHPAAGPELSRYLDRLFADRQPAVEPRAPRGPAAGGPAAEGPAAVLLPAEPADGSETTVQLRAPERSADRRPAAPDPVAPSPAAPSPAKPGTAAPGTAAPKASLETTTAEVRELLAHRPDAALERLQEAVRRFGDLPELLDLQFEIVQASLETDGETPVMPAPPSPPPRREARPPQALAGAAGGAVPPSAADGPVPPLPAPAAPPLPSAAPPPARLPAPAVAPRAAPAAPPSPPAAARRAAVSDLTLTGIGLPEPAAEDAASAAGPEAGEAPASESFLDFSSARFWVFVAVMVTVLMFFGMWLATRWGPGAPPLPELEAEDVVEPVAAPPAEPLEDE